MLTKDETENLISEKEEIKKTLSLIIKDSLDFVAIGVVEKTAGTRFLLCDTGFKPPINTPLWKTPGGRPETYGKTRENPLDTVAREIEEEIGVITYQPMVDNIFLIQKNEKQGREYYCICFDLKYFSGEVKKGSEVTIFEEFSKNAVCEIIISKIMVHLHVPIWKYYLKNYWK